MRGVIKIKVLTFFGRGADINPNSGSLLIFRNALNINRQVVLLPHTSNQHSLIKGRQQSCYNTG